MNEELYRDMCLIYSIGSGISAKRLLSGDINNDGLDAIKEAIERSKEEIWTYPFFQYVRLSVDETSYWESRQDIPFEEFLKELESRMKHQSFLKTTFRELIQELSIRLNMDAYQLAQGNITESQKMSIRLMLSQLEDYQPDEIELFMNELKKRKDNH